MLAGDADWQPSGSTIVFATSPLTEEFDHGPSVLYTMQSDGTRVNPLIVKGPADSRATQPRWTPNGRSLLYTQVAKAGFPLHTAFVSLNGAAGGVLLSDLTSYVHPVLQP